MSEVVFSQTFERRDHVDAMEHGRTTADHKVSIFRSPDKVSVVHSDLVVGVPLENEWGTDKLGNKVYHGKRPAKGKRYFYWRTTASSGFRRNAAGNIVPFSCTRPWDAKVGVNWRHKFPTEPFNWLEGVGIKAQDDDAGQAFQHAVWLSLDFRTVNDLFPMMGHWNFDQYGLIPSSLRGGFRQPSMQRLAEITFGKTRTTPRLVAAMENTEPYMIAYAQQYRGLVRNELLAEFLETSFFDEEMEEGFRPHSPNIRPLLLHLDQSNCERILSAGMDLSDSLRVKNLTMFGPKHLESVGRRFQRTKATVHSLTDLGRW